MLFLEKFRKFLPKEKSNDELDSHYSKIELEKGDLLAMFIAGIITFSPIIILISIIYFLISILFGL